MPCLYFAYVRLDILYVISLVLSFWGDPQEDLGTNDINAYLMKR